jgi:hypothetical protein
MQILFALAIGIALAFVLIRFARSRGGLEARRIYAVGLFVTALLYVLLAARGAAPAEWLAIEGLGVVIYGSLAWIGIRRWPRALALGWAAHVLWDFLLHLHGTAGAYTPDWWPWFCLSFDLVIAGGALQDEGSKSKTGRRRQR